MDSFVISPSCRICPMLFASMRLKRVKKYGKQFSFRTADYIRNDIRLDTEMETEKKKSLLELINEYYVG